MTNFGVFGTILSIDEDENQVLIETSPGTVLTRAPPDDRPRGRARRGRAPSTEVGSGTGLDGEPEFGERVDDAPTDEAPDTKKSDD